MFHVVMDTLASLDYSSVKFSEGHSGRMAIGGAFVDIRQNIAVFRQPASQCAS